MAKRRLTQAQIFAAAVAQIHSGIAKARAAGVVCGEPQNIRLENYWRTVSDESIRLSPKIPYIGPKGAFNAR